MNSRDKFEYQRALKAREWFNHPDRIIENAIDKIEREKKDIKLGHSVKCSLTKCHSECTKDKHL